MEIVEIYQDWLYSISFDEEDLNEYHRIFREWHDLDYLIGFFSENKEYIDNAFWRKAGLNPDDPELSAERVIDEADNLECYIREIVAHCISETKPDDTIQNSPVLKDNVFKKTDAVLSFLKANGISDVDDL